jgi:hypothetical protein
MRFKVATAWCTATLRCVAVHEPPFCCTFQGAALQLLSGLPLLQSLKLSGAELLLPTGLLASTAAPQAPGANPAAVAPPAPAGYGEAAPQPAQPGQPQMLPVGGAVAAAAATASGRAPLRSMASAPVMGASLRPRCAAAGAGAAAGAHLDRLAGAPDDAPQLGGAAWAALAHVADLRLRFNCCGTSVERTLLALGPRLRARLAGLTWSYGKLGGPGYLRLLSSCTSLRCGPVGVTLACSGMRQHFKSAVADCSSMLAPPACVAALASVQARPLVPPEAAWRPTACRAVQLDA